MTAKISLPISDLNEDFLQQLKKQYGEHTRLDIQVVEMDETPSLSEDDFWQIIALLKPAAKDKEERIAAAVNHLATLPTKHIYQFEDLLAEKLFSLDTAAHAAVAYPDNSYLSVDGFLYLRAGVVAEGLAVYQRALDNPASLNKEADFEPLLSLAALAYQQKTGRIFNYISPISYETYANEEGWS
jgi:hypothetical protein